MTAKYLLHFKHKNSDNIYAKDSEKNYKNPFYDLSCISQFQPHQRMFQSFAQSSLILFSYPTPYQVFLTIFVIHILFIQLIIIFIMLKEIFNQKLKEGCIASDSQNQSDKTKDTTFKVNKEPLFTYIEDFGRNLRDFLVRAPGILINICNGTSASDKLVRLTSAIIKLMKNFQIITFFKKFDKFSQQITQLRRLLRINRIIIVLKDYLAFIKKQGKKKRDFFDIFFKTVMLLCDINDMLAYFMHLQVIKQRGLASLKKNVANIYFLECVLWTCQHIYDYCTKDKTEAEIQNRRVIIAKYMMDTAISHNDFSQKMFTIGVKQSTILGLLSSVLGIVLIWK